MSQYLNSLYRACESGLGEVIRVCDILRSWAKEHRRDQHPPIRRLRVPNPRRSISPELPTPPPTPPQGPIEPLFVRKRKSAGSPNPMSRAKRQNCAHYKTTASPWASQSWAQQNVADANNRIEGPRDTHATRGQVRRVIRKPRRRFFWNPSKYERSPSPSPPPQSALSPHVRFSRCHPCPYYAGEFHQDPSSTAFTKSSISRRGMREEDESSSQNDIDENTLQAANFTPLKPTETDGVPSATNETNAGPAEEIDGEEDSDWDKEGSKEHRDLLRSQPSSYDEDGLRLPIYGVLSPQAQLHNDNQTRENHAQAAHEQQTPSRPPRSTSLTKASSKLPAQPADEEDANTPAEAAVESFGKLTLEPTESKRTPKSGEHRIAQEKIQKRISERRAELEAAKEVYPLVPLSKSWDDKVRQAINHGHGRFDALMFARCVPEYSNNGRRPTAWLDDAVINDYITMVAKHGSKNDSNSQKGNSGQVQRVSALSSYFYTKISSPNPNYASCARMIKKAGLTTGSDLLLCDTIFIPINISLHWFLAVIEPSKRSLTVYNSYGNSGNHQVATHIMDWIRHELGKDFKEEEWKIDAYGHSPQQKNGLDCGVFTCTTARQFMLRRFQDVKTRYKEPVIQDMRRRIVAELINEGLLNKAESES